MPKIEYVRLFEQVESQGFDSVQLTCCDASSDEFKLLRVQIQGEILCSPKGVWIEDTVHDLKCRKILELANEEFYDLVLFPEYCISYDLMKSIVSDRELWPDDTKLWCLPCQGIPKREFDAFIEFLRNSQDICLIDTAIADGVRPNPFVNAMFYCFRVKKSGKTYLCLAPQMKTHHMSDPNCICEAQGLSTGSRIFTLGDRLITFLCADTLNNEISWQALQNEKLTNGIIILHPQLNQAPKNDVFRNVRTEMWRHNHPGICITCNWAENTHLIDAVTNDSTGCINFSWSCVYQKYANLDFEKWQERSASARRESARNDFFAAFMPKARTEVWFSTSAEQATAMMLPNPTSTQYAVTGIHSIKAISRYCWREKLWEPQLYTATLEQRLGNPRIKDELDDLADLKKFVEARYHFPLLAEDKYIVDRFFDITIPNAEDSILTIDEQENLADWALLLDQANFDTARDSLTRLLQFIDMLKEKDAFPSRLPGLQGTHEFIYEHFDGTGYCFNINSEVEKMLIVFCKNSVQAKRYSKKLIKEVFHEDDSSIEKHLGVVYLSVTDHRYHFLPECSKNITFGSHIIMEGDLTNGGN